MSATSDRLRVYRARRAAGRTPEPFGPVGAAPPGRRPRFVVQKHAARRTHCDLRLERNGVLVSWAVPQGPSPDPSVKRLAVATEDHPLDYARFEGKIPEGNYGAGAMIVWDQGFWVPLEDPDEGLRRGRLAFELCGYKLRGAWTLVRTKGSAREWLLVKKGDAFASPGGDYPQESVYSGLTVEELRDGSARAAGVRAELERRGAPRRRVNAGDLAPMLAGSRDEPFSASGWLFEVKYDGYRMLLVRDGARTELRFRGGRDATAAFPDLARALAALPADRLVLDGEVVVLDPEGRPSFQRLQRRVHLVRAADAARAAVELPATAFLFDLLAFEDFDVRPLPLVERKALLARIAPRLGPLRFSDHVEGRGELLYEEVRRLGLEGIVAKRADSPYRAGRSGDWLKIRVERTGDFAVVGWTRPAGSRSGFGALHLGAFDGDELVYVGRVGSGFRETDLAATARRLEAAPRTPPPGRGAVPAGPGHTWVRPELVAEVRYRERTDDGLLRQPVFVRFRDDKSPRECALEEEAGPIHDAPELPEPAAAVPERRIDLSNPDKVFWPDEGYTKRDLFEYYRAIAPAILPWLRDRPVVLTRYPDGIRGKSFYQKDAPAFVPDWIRTERVWSEHAGREIDYFVCDDVDSLLYLVNLGTIPIHVWSSRVGRLASPDWCVLDLDPKEAPFRDVIRVALEIRRLCDGIGLPSFVKTSGASGLHVLVPLAGLCTYEQSRQLGELLSRVIVGRLPEISTITRSLRSRGGKVYLDYLQNRHGQTIAAPFSVRPLAGAPVSMPLSWSEVGPGLHPRKFHLRSAPRRVRRWKSDPCLPVLDERPDLATALARLGEVLGR